ncbi:MAG: PEP-CTERM sorting domain-containing protein [Vicinamibacterales bacterium]
MSRSTFAPRLVLVACLMLGSSSAEASHFTTITIDGLFGDWAGVPVVDSDPADNTGGPDIGDTQIANDDQYLYIRNTFLNNLALSTYLAIDVDQNLATGFDVLGQGVLGSEATWQNDFGFSQATGQFNSGPLSGADFFGAGHALLAPFGNFGSRELAISLANTNNGNQPTFPGNTIRLVFYTDSGTGADGIAVGQPRDQGINGDITAVIEYTLAPRVVPEPGVLALLVAGAAGFIYRRRTSTSLVP